MQGSVLKRLAAVADLSRLDIEAAALTVVTRKGRMLVGYAGAYARGYRRDKTDADDFSVSVPASRFKIIAGMFADDEAVAVRRTEGGLALRSRTSHADLTQYAQESDFPIVDRNNFDFSAVIAGSVLISELDVAGSFVADSYLKQVLTGVHIDFRKDALVISAYDGFGAYYESALDVACTGVGSFTVPKNDFEAGARLTGDKSVTIASVGKGNAAVLLVSNAMFHSSIFNQPWPDTAKITESRHTARFQIDSAQLRNLCASSKALDAGEDIDVVQDGKRIVFAARSEIGAFTTMVRGDLPTSLKYGRTELEKVSKLGGVLDFFVPDKAQDPTRIESDNRKCWIVTRI